jgi:hypothetical protein
MANALTRSMKKLAMARGGNSHIQLRQIVDRMPKRDVEQ